ncbi:hypothetical protein GQ44DRAFT_706991 [Phaeosphaeriaceae sp. PMI808]|nr:hypothetical protein GQ44DRAFT_706991 [Phaeosphaeriaceae sp. PMI808]
MDASKSFLYSISTGSNGQHSSTSTALYANSTSSPSRLNVLSANRTRLLFRSQLNSIATAPTEISYTLYTAKSTTLQSPSYDSATAIPTATTPAFSTPSPKLPLISPSAAMGIGVAAGVVGILILLTTGLLFYRCWKARRSPQVRYYQQARLWKGFTPATPNSTRTTFVESKMATIYFTELENPATPGIVFSPPLHARQPSWPLVSPGSEARPIELPV